MLRLSKKADYALIAMKHLALRGDRGTAGLGSRAPARSRSCTTFRSSCWPRCFSGWCGAGCSRRTRARAAAISWRGLPTQISVADVIQAIDGPVTVTACSTDEGHSASSFRSATCAIRCGGSASGF